VSAAAVSLRGVSKAFEATRALHDVSLEVAPGEFVVLLGPSGSGKTTLLRCLAGIERPSAGEISIGGRLVAGPRTFVAPEHRELAMVFQDYALWPHLDVSRNVGYALERRGVPRDARERAVADLLARVGLADLAHGFPNQLSGGEQQRVALARALGARAGLILFDEPLSNLDADRREQLRVEIATLTRESGASVVYITHDQSEALALADRIAILRRGCVVQVATPEELYRRPADGFVARFTGVAGEFAVAAVEGVGLGRAHVRLRDVPDATLEAAVGSNGPPAQGRLFVRAAGVTLHPSSHGAGVAGRILDVAFTGRGYDHVVGLAEGVALARVHDARRHERGEVVRAVFDPISCLLLEEDR
jgi:iron(III) transport system ATP-binding protein